MRALLLPGTLILAGFVAAQTQVVISNVKITEKDGEQTGIGNTIILDKSESSDRAIIYQGGDVLVETWVKVSTHNVRRSSVKDSAVNLIFEIDMRAGSDKDNKRVEKIFYLDQARTSTVKETFNFKEGINMRGITLSFDVEIQ